MPYGDYAECPNCGKIAYGVDEIEKEFGYRNVGNGRIIPQSWCRDCRSTGDSDKEYESWKFSNAKR